MIPGVHSQLQLHCGPTYPPHFHQGPFLLGSRSRGGFQGTQKTAPILVHPDPDRQFIIEVDATNTGVGAILSQRSAGDAKVHPCAFYSPQVIPGRAKLRHRKQRTVGGQVSTGGVETLVKRGSSTFSGMD